MAAVQPLDPRGARLLRLLSSILADGSEVDMREARKRAVVIRHQRDGSRYVHARAVQRIEDAQRAPIIRRHHGGRQITSGEHGLSRARTRFFGVIAGDDPDVVDQTIPAHRGAVAAPAIRCDSASASVDKSDSAVPQAGAVVDGLADALVGAALGPGALVSTSDTDAVETPTRLATSPSLGRRTAAARSWSAPRWFIRLLG